MHAIVNKITLTKPLEEPLLRRVETELFAKAREVNPGLTELQVVRVSDTEIVLLAFYTTREALDEVSSKVAGPWFAENVRPFLAAPVQRMVGEVVASAKAG